MFGGSNKEPALVRKNDSESAIVFGAMNGSLIHAPNKYRSE
jgi:hypothetical protein